MRASCDKSVHSSIYCLELVCLTRNFKNKSWSWVIQQVLYDWSYLLLRVCIMLSMKSRAGPIFLRVAESFWRSLKSLKTGMHGLSAHQAYVVDRHPIARASAARIWFPSICLDLLQDLPFHSLHYFYEHISKTKTFLSSFLFSSAFGSIYLFHVLFFLWLHLTLLHCKAIKKNCLSPCMLMRIIKDHWNLTIKDFSPLILRLIFLFKCAWNCIFLLRINTHVGTEGTDRSINKHLVGIYK